MGCDGGTIPRRDELVRLKKKPEQVSFYYFRIISKQKYFLKVHYGGFMLFLEMPNVFIS